MLSITIVAQENETILVGHLTYHTGPFGEFGPHFDGVTDFTLEIINENPPLGRNLIPIHEDIGTIGEARAVRKLVLIDGVEILLNPAHSYELYRDWIQGVVTTTNHPIMPSVHGGAIERTIGGNSNEPLFRGSPMDSAQGVAAILQLQEAGLQNIVLISSEIEGHQLQRDVAVRVADELGINIMEMINIQSELPSYQTALSSLEGLNPDAIVVFSSAIDGGLIVRDLMNLNISSEIIGTTEWQNSEFLNFATQEAIDFHDSVLVASFVHQNNPAWDFYLQRWTTSDYADLASPENSYNLQYYDLLIVTALAIEAAGTTEASAWVEYMPIVSQEPGTIVYTYADAIEALRRGEDINYSGISGEMIYNENGVVSALFGIFEWTSTGELQLLNRLDGGRILELDS
ncbi:MAG: ABC transporter substrate-binding protein [Chloroflexota bacterium]